MADQLPAVQLHHHRDLRRIPVMFVVLCILKMPIQFSGVRVQRQQTVAVEIIALALGPPV
jgi:hypothetical protein